ncbi:MAG: hypothetical protein N4A44_03970 [Alphaproteobacteria bacterium]|jgi:hypothetical protein|nr:hypothetical protein [Alphaproteobacteria bacterium]
MSNDKANKKAEAERITKIITEKIKLSISDVTISKNIERNLAEHNNFTFSSEDKRASKILIAICGEEFEKFYYRNTNQGNIHTEYFEVSAKEILEKFPLVEYILNEIEEGKYELFKISKLEERKKELKKKQEINNFVDALVEKI